MGPEALAQVLRPLAGIFDPRDHPQLLRGLSAPDDAAVWRVDDERAMVLTTDFFPPIVDDAHDFGRIAAANALSDIYAMGARPLVALNLVAFPNDLPAELLGRILAGGAEAVKEAGAVVAGGHSTVDPEPKYGLAVLGEVHPDRVRTKGGASAGERLWLTKPLGTGLVTTAARRDAADPDDLRAAIASMGRLNREAAERLPAVGAVTDVTGFGLVGHGCEVAAASGVDLVIDCERLPLLPGARRYAEAGMAPGGTRRNRDHFQARCRFEGEPGFWADLLFDPQTSGGLLFSGEADADAHEIGRVEPGDGSIRITGISASRD